MIADINQVNLHSKFFAELVKADSPVSTLEDGIVYIKTNNKGDWNEAVKEAKESFDHSSMRGSWIMKYDIDVLPEELYANEGSIISTLMGTDNNLIMPVFLPDRKEQYYFVGAVANVGNIEPAASFLSVDVQNLMEACLPYALANLDESELESILQGVSEGSLTDKWADEVKRLNADLSDRIAFRGLAAPNPLAMLGEAAIKAADAVKNGLMSYKKQRKMIMNLASTAKKLRSEDPMIKQQGNVEFAQAYQALGEHEKILLMKALIRDAKPKALNNILASIADRETLGERTKYTIVFKPWNDTFKDFGYKDYCTNCIFVAEGETLHPLKMGKSSLVIYTLNLIDKVAKNNRSAIVQAKANEKAFKDVYKILFNDSIKNDIDNKDNIEKRFKELFMRNSEDRKVPSRSGRLPEVYKDIEAALQHTFMHLDEDYSPFLTNATTPLAINAEKIMLPPELLKIKIH